MDQKGNPNLNRMPNPNHKPKIFPNRLDTQTKVSLMASILYGLSDCKGVEDAVDIAFQIDNMVNERVNKLKRENPPRDYVVSDLGRADD